MQKSLFMICCCCLGCAVPAAADVTLAVPEQLLAKHVLVHARRKSAGSIGVRKTLGRRPPCRVFYTPGNYAQLTPTLY